MLQVHDLTTGYHTEPVLRGVSFDIQPGQILVMLGHNGAGKSSLVKTLTGLLAVWQGQIQLNSRDITREPAWKRVRAGLAVSFQDEATFRTMSVRKNLLLGAYVHSQDEARIAQLLDHVLEAFPVRLSGQVAWTLSGGERRMLSIGMALMADPKVLLLDEPSTGLSPARTHEVIDTIMMIRGNFGKSVLLIEQNVQEALRCADCVVVLKSGTVVYRGDPERLSKDPRELIALF